MRQTLSFKWPFTLPRHAEHLPSLEGHTDFDLVVCNLISWWYQKRQTNALGVGTLKEKSP